MRDLLVRGAPQYAGDIDDDIETGVCMRILTFLLARYTWRSAALARGCSLM